MNMQKSQYKLCLCCMEEHNVKGVQIKEKEKFKNKDIEFTAIYEFCSNTNEYLETEEMIRINSLALKDAYRLKAKLLISTDIINIRKKYGISQKDFSEILDWGKATITRYETHYVQDRAHDDILRKIDSDPKWFIDMLKRAESKLSLKAYNKYYHEAREQYNKKKNQYLIDSICAIYANFDDEVMTGNTELNLNKVVEVINYLSKKVKNLHKVKLMKMLWFSDILNYKRYDISITGLAYSALPNGAVPEGYDQIVLLEGVCFDTVLYDDNVAYKFRPSKGFIIKYLSDYEIETIDKVISEFGDFSTKEIVDKMHEEDAYQYTKRYNIISYSFAHQLSID